MKIENGTLVVALDGAKMLLFRNDGDSKYPVLATVLHEEAASLASREIGAGATGRVRSSMGDGGSAYGETDWHDQAETDFLRHCAKVLEEHLATVPEAGIVVIAPPRSLGILRAQYGHTTGKRVISEIGKDLVRHETDDVISAIAAHEA